MTTTLAGNTFFFNWEPALMAWLQAHMGGFGKALSSFFTLFGGEYVLIVALCFLYFVWDKEIGKKVGRRLMFTSILFPMAKNVACRLRPYMVHKDVACLSPVDSSADLMDVAAQGYSFPSGHAANSSTVYLGTAREFKKKPLTIAMIALTVLIGISRFCVGVHYPTDVLVGWCFGLISIFGIALLENKLKNKWIMYLILVVIGLPGFFYCKTNDFFTSYGMLIGFAAADYIEGKYVRFENTRIIVRAILRILGGVGIYLGLNALLKVPFSKTFLESGTILAYLVRTVRYAIVVCCVMGFYPMLFKYTSKFGTQK